MPSHETISGELKEWCRLNKRNAIALIKEERERTNCSLHDAIRTLHQRLNLGNRATVTVSVVVSVPKSMLDNVDDLVTEAVNQSPALACLGIKVCQ